MSWPFGNGMSRLHFTSYNLLGPENLPLPGTLLAEPCVGEPFSNRGQAAMPKGSEG